MTAGLPSPVTVLATRTVSDGYQTEFETFLHQLQDVFAAAPGHLGLTVIRPRHPTASTRSSTVRQPGLAARLGALPAASRGHRPFRPADREPTARAAPDRHGDMVRGTDRRDRPAAGALEDVPDVGLRDLPDHHAHHRPRRPVADPPPTASTVRDRHASAQRADDLGDHARAHPPVRRVPLPTRPPAITDASTEIKRPSCTRTIRIHPLVSRHAVKIQEDR